MKNFHANFGGGYLPRGSFRRFFGSGQPHSNPNSLTMTCAQVRDYIRKHGQTLLTTGIESGNYSANYDECGGTVPGYACTETSVLLCRMVVRQVIQLQVNSQVHDQRD